ALKNPFSSPLNIGHMLRHAPPSLDHVLPGLLAATVGLLVGPGAVSKTMLALQVGIAMATGTPLLDGLVGSTSAGPSRPQRVVLVLAEESAHVVWHRLHAIASVQLAVTGVDPDTAAELLGQNLVVHALAGGDQVNLLGDCWEKTPSGELLRKACDGARLVILDPVRDFHNADENDSTAMKALARHIASYAASTGAAWLLVHHASRAAALNGYGGSADACRGSTALTNAVRWQMNLSRPTRETAKQHGIPANLVNQTVLVDIPKANYVETAGTLVVRRGPHGVLMLPEALA
ncbi:MAG: AAA family ATPase, partial [Proteobacteria bacterium]|nr:AAA family ATPase [Pseudomonadota bacterium]